MRIVRATFHLNDADLAALTGAEPKLSRIPTAHWRNVYQYADPSRVNAVRAVELGCEELASGVWRYPVRHLSREIAEQRGRNFEAWTCRREGYPAIRWLRAEKFEGEPP